MTQILTKYFLDYAPGYFCFFSLCRRVFLVLPIFHNIFCQIAVFLNIFFKWASGRFNFTGLQDSSVHLNIDFLKSPLVTAVIVNDRTLHDDYRVFCFHGLSRCEVNGLHLAHFTIFTKCTKPTFQSRKVTFCHSDFSEVGQL